MQKEKKKKIGLALSGGSALGIAHIGALKALKENDIEIDCISGTSAGAVVAACHAFGVPLETMVEISKKLSWSNIGAFGYSKLGLNSNKPVGKIIMQYIGDKNIEDANIPLAIIAADIDTGEKIVFRSGNLAQAVMASACIPVFFVPVKIGKRKLVDGGLVENVPFSPLKAMGAEIEIGVDLGSWRTYKKTQTVLDVINNSYGILVHQQDLLMQREGKIVIEPHLEKFTPSDFKKVKELMRAGFTAAKQCMPEIISRSSIKISWWEKFAKRFDNLLSSTKN